MHFETFNQGEENMKFYSNKSSTHKIIRYGLYSLIYPPSLWNSIIQKYFCSLTTSRESVLRSWEGREWRRRGGGGSYPPCQNIPHLYKVCLFITIVDQTNLITNASSFNKRVAETKSIFSSEKFNLLNQYIPLFCVFSL